MCQPRSPPSSHPCLLTVSLLLLAAFVPSTSSSILKSNLPSNPAPVPLPNLHAVLAHKNRNNQPHSLPDVSETNPAESRWRNVEVVDNMVYGNPLRGKKGVRVEGMEALNGPKKPSVEDVGESEGVKFLHGIASGDPFSDSVILWTKITPPPTQDTAPIVVMYEVFDSPIVDAEMGAVLTGPEVDYTVKVDVKGLRPATRYYYRFYVSPSTSTSPSHSSDSSPSSSLSLPIYSPSGTTLTLPSANADIDSLNLAVVSCSNAAMGYFNAYANVAARKEVDVVVHLGDYIYEYADGEFGYGAPIGRTPEPNVNLRTLSDYRTRHAQYKRDPDLQAAHAAHPWIVIWDDHEFMDNIDGTGEHDARIRAGMRAYFEYLPIRETQLDRQGYIYRSFSFGNLFDLIMLDTRIEGREVTDVRDTQILDHPNRTILGAQQEDWFFSRLMSSQSRNATWRLVGNQVVFSPLQANSYPIGVDSWDGYPTARQRVLTHLSENHISNTVFVTGDVHASFVFDVPSNPFNVSSPSLAVELVGPSISSPTPMESLSLASVNPIFEFLVSYFSPHNRFVNLREHGYMMLHITRESITTRYHYVESVRRATRKERLGAVARVVSGKNRVEVVEVMEVGGLGGYLRRGMEGGMKWKWWDFDYWLGVLGRVGGF
ncbi:hypothetical protein HDV00_010803 [Rhizophlyctis rosea]|nr:hypothetical protein HDV00_010803 [Rhizophlyctis rosea]